MNSTQKALAVYMEALSKIGYKSRVYVLQAADFGVPQFRERVVIISATDEQKQNNQTTTSNFPCNFNFTVSNMNRFN